MKTYIALDNFSVEQTPVPKGAVIGKGDIDKGQFTAEEGFEVIQHGHVQGRFGYLVGIKEESVKVEDAKPEKQEQPKQDKPKRGRPKKKKSINLEG